MSQIEEMAKVPMKMMEDFIPLRKKCASFLLSPILYLP
jgi:hypothetical protein